eukprot:Gb_33339 [translate_table: standard]
MDVKKKTKGAFVDRADLKRKQALMAYINTQRLSSNKRLKTEVFKCCCWGKDFVSNYNNFRNSGIPARVMYFSKGEWVDFSAEIAGSLKEAFRMGKSAVEITMDGLVYLVDFLRMSQIDLSNGRQRSISWIDINGKCYFPRVFCEGNDSVDSPSIDVKIDVRINGSDGLKTENCEVTSNSELKFFRNGAGCLKTLKCELVDNSEAISVKGFPVKSENLLEQDSSETCSNPSTGSNDRFSECQTSIGVPDSASSDSLEFSLLGDNLIKLQEGDREYVAVRNRFLAGLSTLVTFTTVVGIYRNSHASISGQARLQAFRRHAYDASRKSGGNANLRYAWHGTSKKGVSGIMLHGFGQPKTPKNGAAYGSGVYLAPEDCSYVSAAYSDIDENGEQHMVLCRVVMGNMEQVSPGSQQYHPSSEQFDTGVDDLKNPKRYIVWSTHMNTHILPEYVVSFKVPTQLHEYWSRLKAKQGAIGIQGSFNCCLQDGPLGCPRPTYEMDGLRQPAPVMVKEEQHKMQGHARIPRSAWMSFPKLFSVIEKFLSSSNISLMKNQYADYKAGKISREDLIKKVRMIAGDELLIAAIKIHRGQVEPSMKEKISSVPRH